MTLRPASTPELHRADGRGQPDAPRNPVDVVLAVVLGAAAIGGMLVLGGSPAVARFVLEVAVAAAIVVWACDRRRSPAILLLPLGICGLLWLQLVPIPDSLLMRMAPISGGAWKIAHEGIPRARGCISIDPAATAAGLHRLLLGVGSWLVVRDIAANAGIRRGLAAALAVAAAAIWGLGLAFPRDKPEDRLLGVVDLAGPIYFWASSTLAPVESAGAANVNMVTVGPWRYPVADGLVGDGFGPFISSNQFAGAMCLTLPLLLAWGVALARRKLPAWVAAAGTVAIVVAAAWTVGVRADSRAGGAALVVGGIAFLALTARQRWWRWTLVIVAGLTAAALVALAAATFGFIPGFETLVPENLRPALTRLLSDNRSIGIRVGLRMIGASPVAGTGLGSYAEVFARFVPALGTFFYAHNDYVQWLAETGLIGGLVAAVVASAWVCRGITWFRAQQGEARILAAGAAAAAIGFASHEFFEWNLHLPAIALVAAIVAGITAPSRFDAVAARGSARAGAVAARLRMPAAIGLVFAVVAATGFLARDMLTAQATLQLRTALAAARHPLVDPKRPTPPKTLLETAIAAGVAAAGRDPANADLPLLLGQLYLHLAAQTANAGEQESLEQSAQEWFTKARRRRAICFGLPERVPPAKPAGAANVARPLGP